MTLLTTNRLVSERSEILYESETPRLPNKKQKHLRYFRFEPYAATKSEVHYLTLKGK